jgi:hypothetical protein
VGAEDEPEVVGEIEISVERVDGPKFATEAEAKEWARQEARRRMNEEMRRRGLPQSDD